VSTDEQHIDLPADEDTEATTAESAGAPESLSGSAETSAEPAAEISVETPAEAPVETPVDADAATESDPVAEGALDGDEVSGEPTGDEDDGSESTEQSAPRGGRRGSGSGDLAARLEREGEIAADFLERLLDIADLDGDLDVDVEGERASVAIVDSSEGRVPRRLVGPNGEVLDALQELTRLAVQARTGDRTRLMLDVAGHRARRREQLVIRAKEAIAEVQQSGEPLRLEAMNPFERKIVHDAVSAAGLQSSSEGVEPDRRIVVRPAD
jgi:spoIIIJ-associated protein